MNIAKQRLHQRTISLDDTIAEAVDVLLAMIGEPTMDGSPSLRPEEVDTALRWYAARLTDLKCR